MTDDAAWNRRAAITAYHAAPEAKPAQVGVKPLEWSTTGDWRWTETTGRYTINENRGQWFLYGANPALHGPYNDYEDAMAAAQSDSAAADDYEDLRAENEKMRELVQQAFRDGVIYGTNIADADPDLAWEYSRSRAVLSNTSKKE